MTDPLIAAARFIEQNLDWIRHAVDGHEPYARQAFSEIHWCAGRIRGIVNGPSEQKYLGPCGAILECNPIRCAPDCPPGCGVTEPLCDGDVYGPREGRTGKCRTCGATVDQDERTAWLDGEVRQHAFRASEIGDAHRINVNTIRSWAARGWLKSYWRTDAGLVTPWYTTDDEDEIKARGPRLHYVGDVLDLAAADAARRAQRQAERARRTAARAAESETAA